MLTRSAHHPTHVRLPHVFTTGQVEKVVHTPTTPLLTELPNAPPLLPCPALLLNYEPLPISHLPGQRQVRAKQAGVTRRVHPPPVHTQRLGGETMYLAIATPLRPRGQADGTGTTHRDTIHLLHCLKPYTCTVPTLSTRMKILK